MDLALRQITSTAGDGNFQFTFSLKAFAETISTCNADEMLQSVKKVKKVLNECEKILHTERKRHLYMKEMHRELLDRDQKETVKHLTMRHSFKNRALPLKIPSPPNNQDEEFLDEVLLGEQDLNKLDAELADRKDLNEEEGQHLYE